VQGGQTISPKAGQGGKFRQGFYEDFAAVADDQEQKIASKDQSFFILLFRIVVVKQGQHIRACHSEGGIE
jgi:hypothetical protein